MVGFNTPRDTILGKILTELRITAKLTIQELSEKSNISPTLVSGYERGKVDPRFSSLEKLLSAMGFELKIVSKHESKR